jgi:hypothetical protein
MGTDRKKGSSGISGKLTALGSNPTAAGFPEIPDEPKSGILIRVNP